MPCQICSLKKMRHITMRGLNELCSTLVLHSPTPTENDPAHGPGVVGRVHFGDRAEHVRVHVCVHAQDKRARDSKWGCVLLERGEVGQT